MNNICEIFNVNTLKTDITIFHDLFDMPLKGEYAENILVRCLLGHYDPKWDQGSHRPGSDVFIIRNGRFGISVKSAKQPQKGDGLSISSYRTESWVTLQEKKDGIRKIEEGIQSYVVFARTESKQGAAKLVDYNIYAVEPNLLAIDSFVITGPSDKGDYKGINEMGVKIAIVKSMSSQVWYTVPMSLVKDGGDIVKSICDVGPFSMKLWNE